MTAESAFRLATVSRAGSDPYAAIVLNDQAIRIDQIDQLVSRPSKPWSPTTMLGLLEDWDFSFDRLRSIVEFMAKQGLDDTKLRACASSISDLKIHAPIPRPPSMF